MRLSSSSWPWDSLASFASGTSSWSFGSLPLACPSAFIYQLGANTTQTVLWCWAESTQLTTEFLSFGCVRSIQPFSGKTYGEFLSLSSANNIFWIQSSQPAWSLLALVIIFLSSPSLLHRKACRRAIHQGPSAGLLRFAASSAGNICSVLDQHALKSLQGLLPRHYRGSRLYNGKDYPLYFGLHGH